MARVTIQDALDYCLVNPDGLSVEELLTKYPEYRDELQPMLALSANIATLEPPHVPVDRRAAMKQRLMASASAAALTVAIIPQKSAVPASPPSPPWWESLAALVRRPALAGALGAMAVVALLWWSAAGSLPDSPLYGLKLAGEDALRTFTSGTSGRIDSYLGSAGARLNDVKEMQRREKLAQAGPAIDNYRSSIANSATLWKQTSGEERTNLAKKLYVSCAQGFLGLASIMPDLSNIAASVRANIGETISVLEDLRTDTGGTLIAADIDVNALLLEADIEPSNLPNVESGTATVTVPAVVTETPAPSATETKVTSPTATTAVQQTSIPTSSRVPPRATPPAPPTSRPTHARPTSRPTHARPTPRPANTHVPPDRTRPVPDRTRHVPPTRVNGLATAVLRTRLPATTPVSGATEPVPTAQRTVESDPSSTPAPTMTPIIMPTQVPPLPTFTISLPTSTPIPPLPTGLPITPLPLPTVTVVLPPPPPLPTLTPLPLPTEIICALGLEDVGISCGLGLCLNASALVHNESSSSVSATWTAELRVRVGLGNYITLSTQTGSEEFAPGDTLIEPGFCIPLPIGTTLIQVRLSLVYAGCSDQQSSGAIQPCGLP